MSTGDKFESQGGRRLLPGTRDNSTRRQVAQHTDVLDSYVFFSPML